MAKVIPGLRKNTVSSNTNVAPKPDPTKTQGGRTEDDFAFGIFKFRGQNILKYNKFCFENNLDLNNEENQIRFLFILLRDDPSLRGAELKEAETIEQAAQIIHEYILKTNDGLQNTIDTAYDLLDRNSV